MNSLGATSVIDQSFDTCAPNMSRNRFQRSSLTSENIAQRLAQRFSKPTVIGSNPIIHAMPGDAVKTPLCVKELMVKAYKFKTLKRYGLRIITAKLKNPIYGAWHPFFKADK